MGNDSVFRLLEKIDTPNQIKKLLIQFIEDFDSQESNAWNREVKQTDAKYHCDILLSNGRKDISSKWNKSDYELSSNELICLFNYYYFPTLFESSFSLFQKIWDSDFEHYFTKNNSLIFIDLGCSTLPSSLAFAEAFNQSKYKERIWKDRELINDYFINSYVFFDGSNNAGYISDFIRKYTGVELDSENLIPKFFNHAIEPIYHTHYCLCTDVFIQGTVHKYTNGCFKIEFPFSDAFEKYNSKAFELRNSMDRFFPFNKYISKYTENLSIIINITELRFSNFFDVDDLIKTVNKIFTEYSNTNLAIIYQSFSDTFNEKKWEIFKSTINIKMIIKDEFELSIDNSKKIKYEILFSSKFKSLVE
jgi:hypothetical protein